MWVGRRSFLVNRLLGNHIANSEMIDSHPNMWKTRTAGSSRVKTCISLSARKIETNGVTAKHITIFLLKEQGGKKGNGGKSKREKFVLCGWEFCGHH